MHEAPVPLATRLGTTVHRSLLLRRASRLGLGTPEALAALAWRRGCSYYGEPAGVVVEEVEEFSNEALAIALMHPCLPWNPQQLRVAAAMTAAEGNDPTRLARLAREERAERVLAAAGGACEPENSFWTRLLALLPPTPPPPLGVFPHPSRFTATTGRQRPGAGHRPLAQWIRPHPMKRDPAPRLA